MIKVIVAILGILCLYYVVYFSMRISQQQKKLKQEEEDSYKAFDLIEEEDYQPVEIDIQASKKQKASVIKENLEPEEELTVAEQMERHNQQVKERLEERKATMGQNDNQSWGNGILMKDLEAFLLQSRIENSKIVNSI